MSELRLGDLSLPLDFATEATAILARRGAGKSNAGVVVAEELYRNDLPFVTIDPKGDWWGIRSSADGQSPGLAVPVFGGRHGDVPLEPGAGNLIADLILGDQASYLSCVLDVSQMTLSEQRRFLQDFGERLFRHKDESGVLTLIFEEAHEYLPQSVPRDSARLVSTYQRIVKQGRQRGLGVLMLTQRSAALNKDCLTQAGALIPMWTMSPQDRAAIKAWVEVGGDAPQVINSLHSLSPGEAWLWWPEGHDEPQRFTFRRRWTFDSGATPKAGQKRVVPRTLADVDLAAVKEQMAETIEKAKADDPKELRKRIRDLEQEIDRMAVMPEPEPERIEVPVLTDNDRNVIEAAIQAADRGIGMFEQMGVTLREALRGVAPEEKKARIASPKPFPAPSTRSSMRPPIDRAGHLNEQQDTKLSKAERAILSVLAQHGRRSVTQVAIITGYSAKSGGFRNALSSLRTKGFIDGRGEVEITIDGSLALGDYEPLPTGRELAEWWKANKLGKAERAILDVLLDRYPAPVPVTEIAELTDYSASSGGFRNALSRLRSLELAEGRGELRLHESLAE